MKKILRQKIGLSKFFTGAFTEEEVKNNALPPVFCGVLANILIILFFTNSKFSIKEAILNLIIFIIFFMSFYFKALNLLWVMGNTPAWYIYRYTFCFVFMYISVAQKSFENIEGTSTLKIILSSLVCMALGILVIQLNLGYFDKLWVEIDLILILAFELLLIWYRAAKKEKVIKFVLILIILLNVANLTQNAYIIMKEMFENLSVTNEDDYSIRIKGIEHEINNVKEKDNSIYRIEEMYYVSENDPLIFDTNSTSFTGSTFSKDVSEFLKNLGYSSEHVSVHNFYENSRTMDMFFGVKYKIAIDSNNELKNYIPQEKDEGAFITYKNPRALSLGFSVSKNVLNKLETEEGVYEVQNSLMRNITGLEEDVFVKHVGNIEKEVIDCEEREFETEGKTFFEYSRNKEQASKLIYNFEVEQDENVYFSMDASEDLNFKAYINDDKEIYIKGSHLASIYNVGSYKKRR